MAKNLMIQIGDFIKKRLPKNFGYAVIVFPFYSGGVSNYISNAQRSDMIKALRETADRLEQKQEFETPEDNIYS